MGWYHAMACSWRGRGHGGQIRPDWRVAEAKSEGLFVEYPAALEVMGSFCEAIQSVFSALAVAMGGFSPSAWTPAHGWAASGGSDSIAVHGDRFVVVETDMVGSFDELRQLLRAGEP
jgi:roadblock/LC7 domain-containing protein